jgi:hypothetical protein
MVRACEANVGFEKPEELMPKFTLKLWSKIREQHGTQALRSEDVRKKISAKVRAVTDLCTGSIHTRLVSRSVKQTIALLPFLDKGNSESKSSEMTLNRVFGMGKGVGMLRLLAL